VDFHGLGISPKKTDKRISTDLIFRQISLDASISLQESVEFKDGKTKHRKKKSIKFSFNIL
jgi:hypothetical protein